MSGLAQAKRDPAPYAACGAGDNTDGHEGRKPFFFEKKKQKTFDYSGCGVSWIKRGQTCKSFLVLFFKKERFLPTQLTKTRQAWFVLCAAQCRNCAP
jgi:hypothetical protein